MNKTPEKANPAIPEKASMFEPVAAPRGIRLALIFGNEAPHGKCPYHGTQCAHCDIGAGEGTRFNHSLNRERLDFFRKHYGRKMDTVQHIVVYNSGSTLNPQEMSSETQQEILRFIKETPSIKRASFDSREIFITRERVKNLLDSVRPDQEITLTLGLESQSDAIRVEKLGKRMSKEQIKKIFQILAEFRDRVSVEINMVFQPPGVKGKEAVEEAKATIQYGLDLMDEFKVGVDFNYHPYYPSWKGTYEYPDHPRAIIQDGIRALIMIVRMVKKHGGGTKIFVGWNDEGHDLQRRAKQKELSLYSPGLQAFNQSQDEKDLRI